MPEPNPNPLSIRPSPDRPRHAQQEIADLLAAAMLRLRSCPLRDTPDNSECVRLGFPGHHHRVWLESRLAYRIQECAFGGLKPSLRNRAIAPKRHSLLFLRNFIFYLP
ncbi:hypothetical protein AGMMS50225_19350 [Betaproteobacteria bacterium]|nr:hypothetical protein AGMMS50225_19350 [Betaproteobacteria bacterium]